MNIKDAIFALSVATINLVLIFTEFTSEQDQFVDVFGHALALIVYLVWNHYHSHEDHNPNEMENR